MKPWIAILPVLMLFRYLFDLGNAGRLSKLLSVVVVGFLFLTLSQGREKKRFTSEIGWAVLFALTFAAQYTYLVHQHLDFVGILSWTFTLLFAVVPLGLYLIAATMDLPVNRKLRLSEIGMVMLGLAVVGLVAQSVGVLNVQGANIEGTGMELISRERSGITFIGGVVPSAAFGSIAMAAFVPALFLGNRRQRLLVAGGVLVGALAVVLTGTRGAMTMVVVIAVAFWSGMIRRARATPRLAALTVILLSLLIPIVYPMIFPMLEGLELNLALEPLRREAQSSVFDLTGRVDAWSRSFAYLEDPEALLVGYGHEGEIAAGLSAELGGLPHPAFAGRDDVHVHNLVLNLMFAGGLALVLPYLGLIYIGLKRAFAHCDDPKVASVLGMLLAWVGIGVHESLLWPHIYFFYFVVLGILAEVLMVTPDGRRATTAKQPVTSEVRPERLPLPIFENPTAGTAKGSAR